MTTVDLSMSSDAYMKSHVPDGNTDSDADIAIGEHNAAAATYRTWIKPDFSSVPAGATFQSAVLKLTPIADISDSARTMSAHRVLRAVVANQITWNVFSTGNSWGTGGCSNSTTDYDGATALGTMTQPASPTLNVALEMTLTAAGVTELQKMYDGTYTNNGIVLFVDTQNNDAIDYASKENGTAAYRPIITLTYTPASSGFFMFL